MDTYTDTELQVMLDAVYQEEDRRQETIESDLKHFKYLYEQYKELSEKNWELFQWAKARAERAEQQLTQQQMFTHE